MCAESYRHSAGVSVVSRGSTSQSRHRRSDRDGFNNFHVYASFGGLRPHRLRFQRQFRSLRVHNQALLLWKCLVDLNRRIIKSDVLKNLNFCIPLNMTGTLAINAHVPTSSTWAMWCVFQSITHSFVFLTHYCDKRGQTRKRKEIKMSPDLDSPIQNKGDNGVITNNYGHVFNSM